MNADNTIKTTAKPSKHDLSRFDTMSEAQRHAAATRDPDAMPLTSAGFKRMKRTPQVRLIRCAFGLTQEEFAGRFHIPLGNRREDRKLRRSGRSRARKANRGLCLDPNADPIGFRTGRNPLPRQRRRGRDRVLRADAVAD